MSGMNGYRDSMDGNSYTRESFVAKYESDSSTKGFMWEKLRGIDLSDLELYKGGRSHYRIPRNLSNNELASGWPILAAIVMCSVARIICPSSV
jgi:hypothetical protein